MTNRQKSITVLHVLHETVAFCQNGTIAEDFTYPDLLPRIGEILPNYEWFRCIHPGGVP